MSMSTSLLRGEAAFTPSYDPLVPHPAHVADPYRVYSELRQHAPMYRSPHGVWIASGHAEVSQMFKDQRFGRGYFYFENMARRMGDAVVEQPIYQSARNMMLMKDGAQHAAMRSIIAKAFSNRSIDSMRTVIQGIADRLIDALRSSDGIDLMRDFAYPLPSAVICWMVGIPEADWHKFSKRTANGSRALEPAPLNPLELAQQNQSVSELREYFNWLVEQRHQDPKDDLVSVYCAAERAGKSTREETLDNLRMSFIGAQETTVNTIGNGLLALFCNPDQLTLLKADASLLDGAVTEIIRYDSSVQMTPRQARELVVMGGVEIEAGETVLCIVASANRDETAFENAAHFDIRRKNNYPFSFGGGPHFCIGAQMGRVEAQIAISTLIREFPRLVIDTRQPAWLPNTVVFRGLRSLAATV